jgi:hypothetical protein
MFPYFRLSNAAKKPCLEHPLCCRNTQCPNSNGFTPVSENFTFTSMATPYIVLHIFLTHLVGLPSNSLTQFHFAIASLPISDLGAGLRLIIFSTTTGAKLDVVTIQPPCPLRNAFQLWFENDTKQF